MSLSDFHGTCFEENLPYPLFQTGNYLQNSSNSEEPMRWHANAGAFNLEVAKKKAIFGHTEQHLNSCQPFTFSTICQQSQSM